MGLIHDLLSRRKEIPLDKIKTVDQLFSELGIEIQEETELFRGFLWWQEKKIESIKKVIPAWEKGHMETIEKAVKEISARNQRLWSITNEILRIDQKEEQLFHFILREKLLQADSRHLVWKNREDILNKKKYQQYAESLKPYFEQLFDFLRSLLRLVYLEITAIKGWGKSAAWRLERDLAERKFFYHLLVDESTLSRKIRQHIILIIRTINQFLGYKKQFGLQIKTIETKRGPREVITWGVIWHEIRDIKSLNFERFYKLYEASFEEDERESKIALGSYLRYAQLKEDIKEGVNRTHLGVGIINGEVVAITFFSTILSENKGKRICFGVGWWTIVAKGYRNKRVGSQLYNFRIKIMQQDAKSFGAGKIDAIFIEVNDPRKMSPEAIAKDAESATNPFERIDFMIKNGFLPMKFEYAQPPLGRGKPVNYIMLMSKPFNKKWIQKGGIPINDMRLIFWFFVRYGFDRVPSRDPTYRKVLRNIENSQENGIVKFGL